MTEDIRRYHVEQTDDKTLPVEVQIPEQDIDLNPTYHAEKEAEYDRYGSFELPNKAEIEVDDLKIRVFYEDKIREGEIFEAYVNHETSNIQKFAARVTYDSEYDATLVISKEGDIVTAWLNKKDDHRDEVNLAIYDDPEGDE